jgi:hypothetical protein
MASNVFPVAASGSSSASTLAKTATAVAANTIYQVTTPVTAGTYSISCVSSTITIMEFYSGTTLLGTATTVSGTVSFNLASDATSYRFYTNTGSNIVVSLQLTGNSLAPVSGTLDTITTSTNTYSANGSVYAVAVGAGGGGGGSGFGANSGGGGGSGGVTGSILILTSPTVITIGASGNAGGENTPGNAGGITNISNLTAN